MTDIDPALKSDFFDLPAPEGHKADPDLSAALEEIKELKADFDDLYSRFEPELQKLENRSKELAGRLVKLDPALDRWTARDIQLVRFGLWGKTDAFDEFSPFGNGWDLVAGAIETAAKLEQAGDLDGARQIMEEIGYQHEVEDVEGILKRWRRLEEFVRQDAFSSRSAIAHCVDLRDEFLYDVMERVGIEPPFPHYDAEDFA